MSAGPWGRVGTGKASAELGFKGEGIGADAYGISSYMLVLSLVLL